MTRAVLWDLDGTIVDSGDLHWQAFQEIMAAEGVPVTWEMFVGSFGQKNDRIFGRWFGPDASAERIARAGEAKEAAFRRLAASHGLQALPGAAEWIGRLRDAGWKQAIASSAPRENIRVMLDALSLASHFDAIVAAEDVSRGKPEPEVFLTAAARLGAGPTSSIVVEDAEAGIEGARRAGMRSIGVRPDVVLAADVYVRSLRDLEPDAFDSLLGRR